MSLLLQPETRTYPDTTHNAFETAQRQFDRVANMLDLDQPTRELLRQPLRETGVRMRDAAYLIAVCRVAQACRERGWV